MKPSDWINGLAADCLAPLPMSLFARPRPGNQPIRRQRPGRFSVARPCLGAHRSQHGHNADRIAAQSI